MLRFHQMFVFFFSSFRPKQCRENLTRKPDCIVPRSNFGEENTTRLKMDLKGMWIAICSKWNFYFSGNHFFFSRERCLPSTAFQSCPYSLLAVSAATDVLLATLCAQLLHKSGSRPPAISLQGHRGHRHTPLLWAVFLLYFTLFFFCTTLSSLSKAQLLDQLMLSQISSLIFFALCPQLFPCSFKDVFLL